MSSISAAHVALSGATAARTTQRVSASAVANLNTDGFEADQVSTHTAPGGGVAASVSPTGAPAPLAQRNGVLVALSNTDLASELVTQMTAVATYRANLAVVSSAAEMQGAALDIVA